VARAGKKENDGFIAFPQRIGPAPNFSIGYLSLGRIHPTGHYVQGTVARGEAEPSKCPLSCLGENIALRNLVTRPKERWISEARPQLLKKTFAEVLVCIRTADSTSIKVPRAMVEVLFSLFCGNCSLVGAKPVYSDFRHAIGKRVKFALTLRHTT
jgi:hypothetical protein